MKRTNLNRRVMLRGMLGGAAAAVALPTLEAMLDANGTALADGRPLPKRFMFWFFGNGVRLNRFEPSATGAGYPLSEELAPLANVQDYVTVCTGLQNRCKMQITHHEGMTAFSGHNFDYMGGLSSTPHGPTLDQVIASKVGVDTLLSSIHVGVSKRTSVMDGGTTMHALSHKGPNQPQYPRYNPQTVWADLFGSYTPQPDDKALRLSILDAVRQDTAALRSRLGAADNIRLDSHLESVSALEKKIQAIKPQCAVPGLPNETNTDIQGQEPIVSVNQAMSDLIAYAFSCDITRVATMLWFGGAAETIFDDLNAQNGHHNQTHDGNAQEEVHKGVVYIMQNLAYLLEKFKSTVDADGLNLLDTSIVYAGSDCSEGYTHSIARQPIIVAGHARNSLIYPGIHYQAAPAPQSVGNISDVLLTCLQAYDPTATSVGANEPMSTTPLEAIRGTG